MLSDGSFDQNLDMTTSSASSPIVIRRFSKTIFFTTSTVLVDMFLLPGWNRYSSWSSVKSLYHQIFSSSACILYTNPYICQKQSKNIKLMIMSRLCNTYVKKDKICLKGESQRKGLVSYDGHTSYKQIPSIM